MGSRIPDYRLDTESVAHILFHGEDVFDDPKWFKEFNWQRFQLGHINSKVDLVNDITNLSGIASGPIFATGGLGHQRYVSLVQQVKRAQIEISELIQKYEKPIVNTEQ